MSSPFDDSRFSERLFFPRPDASPPPDGARDLTVAAKDGVRLHVRRHHAKSASVALLLFHGNGEVVADYDDMAPRFAACGAALTIMDYRGYGQSEGTPSLRSALADAGAVFDAVVADERREHGRPVVVMGRSLGSACAAELTRVRPNQAIAYVLESGATDLIALMARRGYQAKNLSADDLDAFDPLPKLRGARGPLLVLHGEHDDLIHPREARLAHESWGGSPKELVLVPGRGHNDVGADPLYWRALGAFVRDLGVR